jgi:hypothetical protein
MSSRKQPVSIPNLGEEGSYGGEVGGSKGGGHVREELGLDVGEEERCVREEGRDVEWGGEWGGHW